MPPETPESTAVPVAPLRRAGRPPHHRASTNAMRSTLTAALAAPALLAAILSPACSPVPAANQNASGAPLASFTSTVNQGAFALGDFPAVVRPLPDNPLGRDEITLARRSETFFGFGQNFPSYMTGAPVYLVPSFVTDDEGAGHAILPGTVDDQANGPSFADVVRAQLDADAADELVGIAIDDDFRGVSLYAGELDGSGAMAWTQLLQVPFPQLTRVTTARLATGDFDQDGRDEIALSASFEASDTHTFVEVFDDPDAGLGSMLSYERLWNHVGLNLLTGDFNADSIEDLAIVLEGNSTADHIYSFRTYLGRRSTTALSLTNNWRGHNSGSDIHRNHFAVGNFDSEPGDEIAFLGTRGTTGSIQNRRFTNVRITLYEYDESTNFAVVPGSIHSFSLSGRGDGARGTETGFACVDRRDDGTDEIAFLASGTSEYELHLFDWRADSTDFSLVTVPTGRSSVGSEGFRCAALEAADTDADGQEELHLALTRFYSLPFIYQLMATGWLEGGDTATLQWGADVTADLPFDDAARVMRPIVAPADLDADGLTVRTTGRSQLVVSDPVPVALLTAAPTEANADQDPNATTTSFSQSTGSTQSFGVTANTTWSVSAGFEASDLSGFFGFSVRGTVAGALARTETESTITTYSTVYTSGADADVILFQGLLFRSHEFEVLSANQPGIVGTYITLDVPLGAADYLWTTDFYHQNVAPELHIDPALLGHTIGDASSYPSRASLEQRVAANVGWAHPNGLNVSQGASTSTGLSIALATEATTETQREQSATAEVEFKAGGATFGASVGAGTAETYSVTTSEQTEYAGTVGGLTDFNQWGYSWGFCVYQPDRPADPSTNEPIEGAPVARPLTVIAYWTDPFGAGH